MRNKEKNDSSRLQLLIIIILTLIASMLPEILFREWRGSVPVNLALYRLIILLAAGVLMHLLFKMSDVTKYIAVLGTVVAAEMLTRRIFSSVYWQETFDMNTFAGNFGGSILLKFIGVLPVVAILLALYKSPAAVYLTKGDLSVKADEISWLGIKGNTISWGKLAVISAVLISLGTIALTVLTVTGSSASLNVEALIRYFPLAVIFAVFNSLSEGILFRSAILGPLKNVLPKKQAVFTAAMIFGIGHYYGAPSGIVGVIMSGLLGWYMTRSMYETRGFAASWIIHFMQDLVIFSTVLMLGQY